MKNLFTVFVVSLICSCSAPSSEPTFDSYSQETVTTQMPVTTLDRCADQIQTYRNYCGQDFSGLQLDGADFSFANLRFANFRGANLAYANFRGANLHGADLTAAILAEAYFIYADLSNTSLNGANLIETNFKGANLMGADLDDAEFDRTVMPNGEIRP